MKFIHTEIRRSDASEKANHYVLFEEGNGASGNTMLFTTKAEAETCKDELDKEKPDGVEYVVRSMPEAIAVLFTGEEGGKVPKS